MFDTKLADPGQNYMAHNTIDGYFDTTYPFVDFTMSPTNPDVGDLVTFDGSASYDPDGGSIVSYSWDFGDGNSDTGMVVTHTYTAYKYEPYKVTLTCTDDEAETWYKTKNMWIWRDITIGPIWYDPSWWLDLSMFENALGANPLIHVAVANIGSLPETFDLNIWAVHDETGYEPIIVPMWGNPLSLNPDTGTGFGTLAFWMATPDDLTGYYTIYSEAVVDDSETSNNFASLRIRLGEANLIMARPDTRHFKMSEWGSELHLYGKAKNLEKVTTASMGLWAWIRFEVLTPESDLLVLDTNAELIHNEEETSMLMTSLEVEPGIYSVTAYAVFSVMNYGSTIFYETDLDWLPLSGMSVKMKTFTVNVVP
jgi:PKD repeat protein